jgi:hypothetical protein
MKKLETLLARSCMFTALGVRVTQAPNFAVWYFLSQKGRKYTRACIRVFQSASSSYSSRSSTCPATNAVSFLSNKVQLGGLYCSSCVCVSSFALCNWLQDWNGLTVNMLVHLSLKFLFIVLTYNLQKIIWYCYILNNGIIGISFSSIHIWIE